MTDSYTPDPAMRNLLRQLQDDLTEELGFRPSIDQAIRYLIQQRKLQKG